MKFSIRPAWAVALSIMLILILGSALMYYIGKSEGKDDVLEEALEENGSLQSEIQADTQGQGQSGPGSLFFPTDQGVGTVQGGAPAEPLFDVNESPYSNMPGSQGYPPSGAAPYSTDTAPPTGLQAISMCGNTYYTTPIQAGGTEIVSRIARIGTAQDGMRGIASGFCPALRARFRPGSAVPSQARAMTISDPLLGSTPKEIIAVGFVQTFAVDLSNSQIYLRNDSTGRLSGSFGTLR